MSETELDHPELPPGPAPPAPPRPLTRAARRRSWAESRVRLWWMLSAALLAVTAYVLARELTAVWEDRQLIKRGTRVAATIEQFYVNGQPAHPGQTVTADDNADFVLRFPLPDGRTHKVQGRLKDQRTPVGKGSAVSIFYDPANPGRWTDRQEVAWGEVFLIAYILAPLAAVLLLIAFLRRRQVLNVWIGGQAAVAIVADSRGAPIAPLSRSVRMHLPEGPDQRLFCCLVPTRFATFEAGDMLWVIAPPDDPGRAIVAALYK